MIKKIFLKKICKAFDDSYSFINQEIIKFKKQEQYPNKNIQILDVGCGEGNITPLLLKNVINYEVYGLDCIEHKDLINEEIIYKKCFFDKEAYPYEDESFDIVVASQVIEHMLNKDFLISECYRVLRKGGLFLCATENIASFDNILSLSLGQEPLSQHTGARYYTNSCLSPHFMTKVAHETGNKYLHKNVCSYFGLKRLCVLNGFKNCKIESMGNLNFIFEKIFKIYNRLIIACAIK